jgi:hypothetical protein
VRVVTLRHTRGVRDLAAPAFPDDDGATDPAVATALAAYGTGAGDHATALAALVPSRLIVPVVAVLGETEVDERGLARDKSADMAAVLMEGRDGRRALLAFTGLDTLAAWDPAARPVPVPARTAALAAVQEGAAAVVVDVAGPVTFVVEGDDLRTLAGAAGRPGDSRPGE